MRSAEVELMIFDLDGTLVNSGLDIARAVNHTRTSLGMDVYEVPAIIEMIGNGFENLVCRAIQIEHPEVVAQARTFFSEYYLEHLLDNTKPYPGIMDTLATLAHRKKILITNKRKDFTDIIVERLNLREHFLEVIGGDTFSYMKPDVRLLVESAHRHGAKVEKTVIVGDGSNDILLAHNGGGISCAHLRGLTKRDLLLSLNPHHSYEEAKEILHLFA